MPTKRSMTAQLNRWVNRYWDPGDPKPALLEQIISDVNKEIEMSTQEIEARHKQMLIEEIHGSLINGQRKQMVEQIDDYGLYDFWTDYKLWLEDWGNSSPYYNFTGAVLAYHRIKYR